MVALSLFGSNVASSTLGNAGRCATTTGGVETTADMSMGSSGAGYVEMRSGGGFSGQDVPQASIPSPTGNGYLLDSTLLEGQTINAGNWSGSMAISSATSVSGATVTVRFYKYQSGTYTSIGTLTSGSFTIGTTRTPFTLPATSFSSVTFGVGVKLYYDVWANASWPGFMDIFFYLSNSGTAGVSGDAELDTPGYGGSSVTHWRIMDGFGGMFS